MKKLIIFLLFATLGLLVRKVLFTVQKRENLEQSIAILPPFLFTDLDGYRFDNSKLKRGVPTLITYFNSDCEHCAYEIAGIISAADFFTNTNVLLITNEPKEKVIAFCESNKTVRFPFIHVLLDRNNTFYKSFGSISIPTSIVYDTKNNLVDRYSGEVDIKHIINSIKKGS